MNRILYRVVNVVSVRQYESKINQYKTESAPLYIVSIAIKHTMKPKKRLPASPIKRGLLLERLIARNPKHIEKIIKLFNSTAVETCK